MLTPQEVSEHAFSKASFGGYNMGMVDEFLDVLTADYTTLYKENTTLKAKMKVLVEKVEETMVPVIRMLEAGETDLDVIQDKLDEMTLAINELEAEFEEHDSELETVARESIAETVEYILEWFQIDIDTETAIRERDW